MVRMKFSAVDGKTLQYKEPARNEGYQMAHLKDVKRKEGRVKESDIQYVTKFKVIGVEGIKENPFHTVVESATPEVDWKKPDFNQSSNAHKVNFSSSNKFLKVLAH